MIFSKGLGAMARMVSIIVSKLRPYNASQFKALLKLANYFQKFMKLFNAIAKALIMLTRKNRLWIWEKKKEATFVD